MAFLTREQIQGLPDVPTTIVSVPEWGGDVKIQSISIGRRRKFREALLEKPAGPNDLADEYLFVACVVEPEFTLDDLPWLREKSPEGFNRVVRAIMTLMKETEEATAAAVQGFSGRSGTAADLPPGGTPASDGTGA